MSRDQTGSKRSLVSIGSRKGDDLTANFPPAGLSYDVPKTIEYHSPFNNPNRTEEDAAWNSELVDQTTLVVALDDSFTESRGVLHSMRWPWDSKKGVYTLNSAHELHCLVQNTESS